jgi:hypothetical protein
VSTIGQERRMRHEGQALSAVAAAIATIKSAK